MSLTDLDRKMVNMNIEAYKKPELRKNVGNYKFNSSISDDTHSIFLNDENKTAFYVIKGTSNKKELLLDLKLALFTGIFSNNLVNRTQINKTLIHFRRVKDILANRYQMFLSGHSLGGIKALYISKHFPQFQGSIFNTYVPDTMKNDLRLLITQNKSLKFITIKGDILSNKIISMKRGITVLTPSLLKQNISQHSITAFKKF
jgi:hypothetical protein